MDILNQIISEVRKALVGKDRVLWLALTSIISRGHILLEDIPGVGKTTMALAFSRALSLQYGRVQFTPDVMPSDITGYSLYNKETGKMTYQPGAILCNLFLADELNRATSRTQSALLEAMEEGQVTVDGVAHKVPEPFIVIATQNPTGAAGTQLLPDSQMDRFAIRLTIGYPSPKNERAMIMSKQGGAGVGSVGQVLSAKQLEAVQNKVAQVFISQEVVDYIVALIGATRQSNRLSRGGSPRAALSLSDMAKAIAFIQDRDFVIPADVQNIFCESLGHRVLLSVEAESNGLTSTEILTDIMNTVKEPSVR